MVLTDWLTGCARSKSVRLTGLLVTDWLTGCDWGVVGQEFLTACQKHMPLLARQS